MLHICYKLFSCYRDVRNRHLVLLFFPTLFGPAQLHHLFAHVQLCHAAHHRSPPCFREFHLQPRWWLGEYFVKRLHIQACKCFIRMCNINRFSVLLCTGSVCSVYPSSSRRGLVIFHEHITDLLSGGVSAFSCMFITKIWDVLSFEPLTLSLHLQGFLEQTYLFYGFYEVDKIHFPKFTYNVPLAYLLTTIAYLFLSLIWIVKRY